VNIIFVNIISRDCSSYWF